MIYLALLWHQHQPFYQNLRTNEVMLPWVRLHAIKDYYGMAAILKEFPTMNCTINLVPSMLLQLENYISGKATDKHQEVSHKTPQELTQDEKIFILDNFFMANWDVMIKPFPRYNRLLEMRDFEHKKAGEALENFSDQDFLDLTVWFEIAWFHPLLQTGDPFIANHIKNGREFTIEDRSKLFEKEHEILKEIIPLHKELSDRKQVELSTTPYYHPILPLLLNRERAKEAMPHVFMPKKEFSAIEDAREHVERAITSHEERFGVKPKGMWPSEGSVSPEVLELASEMGLNWLATDEEILSNSTGINMTRDFDGKLQHPADLCQPYFLNTEHGKVNMIFREHYLSDLIGFKYQWLNPRDGVNDFIHRLHEIGHRSHHKNPLVPVILDGENCWEYYHGGGLEFLRALYGAVVKDTQIKAVTMSEYLEMFQANREIENIFSGSWINHNFGIWIGHPEDNKAWDLLAETRQVFVNKEKEGSVSPEDLAKAKEELFIAEGSDWFWWFGDDHSSLNDAQFDALFREHLKNVYHFLGEKHPSILDIPIKHLTEGVMPYTTPRARLMVVLDGFETSNTEWQGAGHYERRKDAGAMSVTSDEFLKDFYFGFDYGHLFIRIDNGPDLREALANGASVLIKFMEPTERTITISEEKTNVRHYTISGPDYETKEFKTLIRNEILEIAIPQPELGCFENCKVTFFISLSKDDKEMERVPKYIATSFELSDEALGNTE